MAAEDYISFDDPFEDSRDPQPYSRSTSWNVKKLPGSPARHGAPWSPAEEEILRLSWVVDDLSVLEIATRLERLPSAITSRLRKIYGWTYPSPISSSRSRNSTIANPIPRPKGTKVNEDIEYFPPANMRNIEPSDLYLMMMLQEGYTTIKVSFQGNPKVYTYRTREDLKPDDYVVVKVGDIFKVAKVTAVDETPQIDADHPMHLKWTVSKVDATAYEEQVKAEDDLLDQLANTKRIRAKEMAMTVLAGRLPEGSPERKRFDEALARVNPHKVLP